MQPGPQGGAEAPRKVVQGRGAKPRGVRGPGRAQQRSLPDRGSPGRSMPVVRCIRGTVGMVSIVLRGRPWVSRGRQEGRGPCGRGRRRRCRRARMSRGRPLLAELLFQAEDSLAQLVDLLVGGRQRGRLGRNGLGADAAPGLAVEARAAAVALDPVGAARVARLGHLVALGPEIEPPRARGDGSCRRHGEAGEPPSRLGVWRASSCVVRASCSDGVVPGRFREWGSRALGV